QSETLGEGRHQERPGMRNQAAQSRTGETARQDHPALEQRGLSQRAQHRFSPPTGRARYDELWRVLAAPPDELAPHVEQQQVVLAPLDGAADDKVIVLAKFLVGSIIG